MNHASPIEYQSHSDFQKIDAQHFLKTYGPLVKSKEEDLILDVGCGDGFVTTQFLGKFFGNTYKSLLGIDKNEKMIDHAKKKYEGERNSFKILDICSNELPKELEGRFDHVFSFYCFHWLNDLSLGLKNVNLMTKTRGDILAFFGAYHPLCTIYNNLAKYPKYAPYMQVIEDIGHLYLHWENKKDWCRNIFRENGFEVDFLDIVDRRYTYRSLADYKECHKAMKPFNIPVDLQEDYYEDFVNEARNLGVVSFENGNEIATENYQVFTVHAINVKN